MKVTSVEEILELCEEYTPGERPQYFFDRNPDNFPSILELYRTGSFHMSEKGCALVRQRDIEYWGVDDLAMEPCCALKYFPQVDLCQSEKDGDIAAKIKETELAAEEDFGQSCQGQWRSWLWNTLEYPWTSHMAQVVAVTSLSMVLISTATFITSTMNELKEDENGLLEYATVVSFIEVIDVFVVIFFTIEYSLRLIVCPSKIKFLKSPMNTVDFIAIIPFYVALVLKELEDFQVIGKAGKIIRLIRIMRILRIFKVVRHVAGLQSLILTIQQAYEELKLLIILLAVAILTYSSLVYFAEKDPDLSGLNCSTSAKEKDPCYSWTMVESFWWGLMTLTTVGYDIYPKTMWGKLIGGFCALSGIFILTLPIPIVVNSFAVFYKNRLWRTEVNALKRERIRQHAMEQKEFQKLSLIRVKFKIELSL